jgi:hypothetical protein
MMMIFEEADSADSILNDFQMLDEREAIKR